MHPYILELYITYLKNVSLRCRVLRIKVSRKKTALLISLTLVSILVTVALALNSSAPTTLTQGYQQNKSSSDSPSPRTGTGILYAYVDPGRTIEAIRNTPENYLVFFEVTYYFRIDGITEHGEGSTINIWASYQGDNVLVHTGTVQTGGKVEYSWSIPTLPKDTEIKFKYGTELTGPKPDWLYAKKATSTSPRLLFAIPEVSFGSLGTAIALFSGLGITALSKRKKT